MSNASDTGRNEDRREAADFYRHYSTLRFTALPVFTTIFVGLFALAGQRLVGGVLFKTVLIALGIAVALAMLIFEGRISSLLKYYQNRLIAQPPSSESWTLIVRSGFLTVYCVTLLVYIVFVIKVD